MYIISEKREIVGTLKTLMGTYHLLNMRPTKYESSSMPEVQSGALSFNVIDDEGFINWIIVRGDFVKVPVVVPVYLDVKRVMTEEEVKEYKSENLPVAE